MPVERASQTSDKIDFRCLKIKQNIGEFFIGVIDASDLISISWADVRRIRGTDEDDSPVRDESEDPRPLTDWETDFEGLTDDQESGGRTARERDSGFEEYLGIQRELAGSRVKQLQEYVTTKDATFPTGILLAIPSQYAGFDDETGIMTIARHSKVAKIIDGQHRIAGFSNIKPREFQVNVVIFIDMALQEQALVFSTINLAQTKVNKSLAYDLTEFQTFPSPQKTCHDIARFLDQRENSPFEDRIKILGRAVGANETITQATFIDRLLRYVSRNPMQDRDRINRDRRHRRSVLDEIEPKTAVRQIFRQHFIDDRDVVIARNIWNYFSVVSEKWHNSWKEVETGNILNRTTGFGALMRFLRYCYLASPRTNGVVTIDEYRNRFADIEITDGTFDARTYLPGSSGEKKLFDELVDRSNLRSKVDQMRSLD